MTSNIQRETAKIYQFPVRGRFAAAPQFADLAQASRLVPDQVADALDGSWYHLEAIRDAELARKN